MKRRGTAWTSLLALLLIGFALVWFLPASWALPLLAPRLPGVKLGDVSGSLWDGRAERVISPKGENLGQLRWQLSRRALLGDRQLSVDMQGPRVVFAGHMSGDTANEAVWTDVHLRVDLGVLGGALTLPGGQPRGVLDVAAGHVRLSGGWPLEMDARVRWQPASMRSARLGSVTLGSLQAALTAEQGVIHGHVHDGGNGPLKIDGELQLSPLARRFTAQAVPRQPDASLQRWLSGLGVTDANGVTHINYVGGLAAAMPEGRR